MAGPLRPAPPGDEVELPAADDRSAPAVTSYPISPESAPSPTWPSGVAPASTDPTEQAHAADLARHQDPAVAEVLVEPSTWADFTVTPAERVRLVKVSGPAVVRVPLVPARNADLTACGKGDYRTHWERFAAALSGAGVNSPVIDLRDADSSDPTANARCYRQVAAAVRGVLPRATFQWTVTRGHTDHDALAAWPGDGVVDIVGIDALDTGADWSKTVNGERGLNWWTDFARRRGAKIAISSWGPAPDSETSGNNAAYVQNMYDWLFRTAEKGDLAYDLYTESASLGEKAAAHTYRSLFR